MRLSANQRSLVWSRFEVFLTRHVVATLFKAGELKLAFQMTDIFREGEFPTKQAHEFILEPDKVPVLVVAPMSHSFIRILPDLEEREDLCLVECQTSSQALPLLRHLNGGILVLHCSSKKEVVNQVGLLRLAGPLLKENKVKVVLTASFDDPKSLERYAQVGVGDVLSEPIKGKTLQFKFDKCLESVLPNFLKEDPKEKNYRDRRKKTPRKKKKSFRGDLGNQFRFVEPLSIHNDFWLAQSGGFAKTGGQWSVCLMGPNPELGRWVEVDQVDSETLWAWVSDDPENDPFASDGDWEEGNWVFKGEQPRFENRSWVFRGKNLELTFCEEEQTIARKFGLDVNGVLEVAQDSEYAQDLFQGLVSSSEEVEEEEGGDLYLDEKEDEQFEDEDFELEHNQDEHHPSDSYLDQEEDESRGWNDQLKEARKPELSPDILSELENEESPFLKKNQSSKEKQSQDMKVPIPKFPKMTRKFSKEKSRSSESLDDLFEKAYDDALSYQVERRNLDKKEKAKQEVIQIEKVGRVGRARRSRSEESLDYEGIFSKQLKKKSSRGHVTELSDRIENQLRKKGKASQDAINYLEQIRPDLRQMKIAKETGKKKKFDSEVAPNEFGAEKGQGPSLTPLAIGFLIAELMGKPDLSFDVIGKKACEYISASCGGLRAEYWIELREGWVCKASNDGKGEVDLSTLESLPPEGAKRFSGNVVGAPIIDRELLGRAAVLLEGEGVDQLEEEYVSQVAGLFKGLTRAYVENEVS